jgi:hypothetical protein
MVTNFVMVLYTWVNRCTLYSHLNDVQLVHSGQF